ncbi:MAG TPA: regulatory protein RecX [Ignavibacteriaceae bacterium]|nr:regulatory protein RecX [Ignavibacteriaceae bacterium]
MKIDRVVKKGTGNVLILFDNSETLILSLEIFLKSGLKKNDEISENRFSALIKENKKFYLKQRAFRLLGRRHHSTFELKQKLFQKNHESELINDILTELMTGGYLDDKKFASVFAEEKLRTKFWGDKKLKSELIKRGIDSKIISEVLKHFISSENKTETAELLAIKKLDRLKSRKYDLLTLRKKLTTFLMAKGYDYDIIKEVSDKILGDYFQED